jgi:hypothetical protein
MARRCRGPRVTSAAFAIKRCFYFVLIDAESRKQNVTRCCHA